MAQTVTAPKKAKIRGYDHELAYIMPHEEQILALFGGGRHADGSQKYGPKGIKSFDPGDGQGDEGGGDPDDGNGGYGGGGDTSGHGGMSVDEGVAASVTDMNDPFGGAFGGLGITSRGIGMGSFGTATGIAASIGDMVGAIAAEMGFDVDEPTGVRGGDPSAFGGGDQGNDVGGSQEGIAAFLQAVRETPGMTTAIMPDDPTKRIEGLDKLADRADIFGLYETARDSGENYGRTMTGDQRALLQKYMGDLADDNQSIDWGYNKAVDQRRMAELLNSDILQATIVDIPQAPVEDPANAAAVAASQPVEVGDPVYAPGGSGVSSGLFDFSQGGKLSSDDIMQAALGYANEHQDVMAAIQRGDYGSPTDIIGGAMAHYNLSGQFENRGNYFQPKEAAAPVGGVPTPTAAFDDYFANFTAQFDEILANLFDVPDDSNKFDEGASHVADALAQEDDRNSISDHIRRLNTRPSRNNSSLSYDMGGAGLNII